MYLEFKFQKLMHIKKLQNLW